MRSTVGGGRRRRGAMQIAERLAVHQAAHAISGGSARSGAGASWLAVLLARTLFRTMPVRGTSDARYRLTLTVRCRGLRRSGAGVRINVSGAISTGPDIDCH